MRTKRERLAGALGLAVALMVVAACPGERRGDKDSASAIPVDTVPTDLSKVQTSLPPAMPDTFKAPERTVARRSAGEVVREPPIPPAPPALMEAVSRERTFSRFCYQEFGQKVDPTLTGGVALVVTVGASGINDAKVASDTWSSDAGRGVNRCLDQRAASAWKLTSGAVPAGKYVVRMTFSGR